MKEKTFQMLLVNIISDEGEILAEDVLQLLHQVREATKAECAEICGTLWRIDLAEKTIKELPTDRIKSK